MFEESKINVIKPIQLINNNVLINRINLSSFINKNNKKLKKKRKELKIGFKLDIKFETSPMKVRKIVPSKIISL